MLFFPWECYLTKMINTLRTAADFLEYNVVLAILQWKTCECTSERRTEYRVDWCNFETTLQTFGTTSQTFSDARIFVSFWSWAHKSLLEKVQSQTKRSKNMVLCEMKPKCGVPESELHHNMGLDNQDSWLELWRNFLKLSSRNLCENAYQTQILFTDEICQGKVCSKLRKCNSVKQKPNTGLNKNQTYRTQ